jgi:hypothetical protein
MNANTIVSGHLPTAISRGNASRDKTSLPVHIRYKRCATQLLPKRALYAKAEARIIRRATDPPALTLGSETDTNGFRDDGSVSVLPPFPHLRNRRIDISCVALVFTSSVSQK